MTRTALGLVLSAAFLAGAAAADMTDYPSEINNDCALFRGTWAAKAPEREAGAEVWTFLSVTDLATSVVDYRILPDGSSTARLGRFELACASDCQGGFTLTLTRRNGDLQSHAWHVALTDRKTLTRTVTDLEGQKTIPYIRYQGLTPKND
ncbi:hypothetical protein sos41_17540 [Alphaproteobacteria bacterium SO-S41]|nr:hypothetical protein sos41_17540 [Alphaproteobacteria bacterium SO-S41]